MSQSKYYAWWAPIAIGIGIVALGFICYGIGKLLGTLLI